MTLDALIQAVIALISLVALVVSVAALRRSSPRLSVRVSTPLIMYSEGTRAMALVELVNNGGADAIIGRVSLATADGSAGFHFRSSDQDVGPSLPHRLEAHGGRGTWAFDYNQLRQSYITTVRDGDLVLRASVVVGSRVYRSRRSISVARPGETGTQPTRWARLQSTVGGFRHPRTQLLGWTDISSIDLEAGRTPLAARNFGWRWGRPFTATLVATKERSGAQERVPNVEQVRFPRIRPRSEYRVMVPLADDPPLGVSLWWSITSGPGVGGGVGAMTWSEARAHKEQFEETRAPGGTEDE